MNRWPDDWRQNRRSPWNGRTPLTESEKIARTVRRRVQEQEDRLAEQERRRTMPGYTGPKIREKGL